MVSNHWLPIPGTYAQLSHRSRDRAEDLRNERRPRCSSHEEKRAPCTPCCCPALPCPALSIRPKPLVLHCSHPVLRTSGCTLYSAANTNATMAGGRAAWRDMVAGRGRLLQRHVRWNVQRPKTVHTHKRSHTSTLYVYFRITLHLYFPVFNCISLYFSASTGISFHLHHVLLS